MFAVSAVNKVRDVSLYADCFSTDSDVLRVCSSLDQIYLRFNVGLLLVMFLCQNVLRFAFRLCIAGTLPSSCG